MHLDKYDRAILAALQQDGRISNVQLAATVNLSESACLRRVRALEDEGMIDRYVALVNQSAAGLGGNVLVHIGLHREEQSELAGLEGFMIPLAAALAEADDGFSVFVYEPDTSTVHKRPIQTGGVGDNTVAVLEGLAEGDIIATAGVSFLRDGQTVTLVGKELLQGSP